MRSLPSQTFVHVLTAIHALGSTACLVRAAGSAVSEEFRESLAVSGGSQQMIRIRR